MNDPQDVMNGKTSCGMSIYGVLEIRTELGSAQTDIARVLVLARFWCTQSSRKDANPQRIEVRSAIHLLLDGLQAIHGTLGRAVAIGKGQRCKKR